MAEKLRKKGPGEERGEVGSVVTLETGLGWSDGQETSKLGRRTGAKEGETVQTNNKNPEKTKAMTQEIDWGHSQHLHAPNVPFFLHCNKTYSSSNIYCKWQMKMKMLLILPFMHNTPVEVQILIVQGLIRNIQQNTLFAWLASNFQYCHTSIIMANLCPCKNTVFFNHNHSMFHFPFVPS